jgi:hypothetical protein
MRRFIFAIESRFHKLIIPKIGELLHQSLTSIEHRPLQIAA